MKIRNKVSDLLNYDFMRLAWFDRLMRWRALQPSLMLFNLFVFVILLMAGFFGNPIGNRNAAIIIIWILWFPLLVVLLVGVGGRSWCMMCPLPSPAEWLSRLAIVRKTKHFLPTLGWKWPKKLDNIWLQNIGFLIVATLSPIIITRPPATAYMLMTFIVLALILSVLFIRQNKPGRLFCRYVCPIGGFIGVYSLLGALEVKVKDPQLCRQDKNKQCITGNEKGWGCPWYEYPGNMSRNAYCGLCTECIKTCHQNNIAVKLRPFAADLLKKRKLDEAYKSFIMVGSALVFMTVFLGWWGYLKEVASPIDSVLLQGPVKWGNLAIYGGSFWVLNLAVLPGVHLLFSWLSKLFSGVKEISLKKLFIDYAYALIPLGMMAWVGFGVALLMINGSYIVSVISDPFGWGWDLLGTTRYEWRPYFPAAVPYVQLGALIIGLLASTHYAYRIARENFSNRVTALRAMVPVTTFIVGLGVAFLYLFI